MIKLPQIQKDVINDYNVKISKSLPLTVLMKSYSSIKDKNYFFESILREKIFSKTYPFASVISEYIFIKKFCSINMKDTSYKDILEGLNIPNVKGYANVLGSIKNAINSMLDNTFQISGTLMKKEDLIREWKRINCCAAYMEDDFEKMGFDYERLTSDDKNKLLYKLNINVCPYCNKTYILAYSDEDRYNSLSDVDHFYPKSIYGLFQLSLYNFIPACSSCNSRFKGIKTELLYPYEDGFDDKASFEIEYASREDWLISIYNPSKAKFRIGINVKDNSDDRLVHNIETFKLKEIYNRLNEIDHQYFVDLLNKKNLSTHSNIKRISKLLGIDSMSNTDYLRMLTGFEMSEDEDLKKPLSKMTRDLWNQK